MTLLVDNDVAGRVLDMADAVPAIEVAFAQLGAGHAEFYPLTELVSPTAADGACYAFGIHLGAIRESPRLALRFKSDVIDWVETDAGQVRRTFNVEPGTYMGVIALFDTTDGRLLALMNDGVVQHDRVGATAGVACDHLAREDAETVGILGSGGMARAYLEAFDVVRDLTAVTVYSPTPDHRERFAAEAAAHLDLDVVAVDDPAAAVRGADIAATCTSATRPVFESDWLEPGQFLVNVRNVEVDAATIDAVDRRVATSNRSYRRRVIGTPAERADLTRRGSHGEQTGGYETLGAVLTGEAPGRRDDDETVFFDNRAAGIQFAAVGDLVHERALDRGLGTRLPHAWFQQSIKN